MKKKLILFMAVVAAFCSCTQKYELDTEFTMPTVLDSPSAVTLDDSGDSHHNGALHTLLKQLTATLVNAHN